MRGTSHAGQRTHAEEDAYVPRIGRAIVHAGRQLHEVTQITQGDRFAYIMWARSWGDSITVPADQANAKGASSKVGLRSRVCSCCWLNRRQDNSCICGRRWN
uniref:Uncharacterized protein n=1 Tax=Craspedostauros australis TaxID=1486917 RepID=A0A7R9WSI5_9STRA